MYHNYFFLKRLAKSIQQETVGKELLLCFSQNKDELILGFANADEEFYIRANLDANISMLSFPPEYARANRNSVDLFKNLIGIAVKEVSPFLFDRSFQMIFENNDSLIFKLHARRSNILLCSEGRITEIFRNNLAQDVAIVPNELHKKIEVTKENFSQHDNDPTKLIPALGRKVREYLEKEDYFLLNLDERWTNFQQLLEKLDTNPIFLHENNSSIHLLSTSEHFTENPIVASNWLYDKKAIGFYFDKEKNQAISQLKQQIKKSESYISKTKQKLNQLKNARNPEEMANIIMANLHQIKTGIEKVKLADFYTNNEIEIKLNNKLSPQKNAENYYRKAKNRNVEIDQLNENILAKVNLVEKLSQQVLEIEEIQDFKRLRKFIKVSSPEKNSKKDKKQLPYHEHIIDGWSILIGKNAKANDELTLKIAKKNDLWLHAKDVAGSHVIIKERSGQNFPKDIIQTAAEYAAYYSKRKTDSLCPVIVTHKKYIRKMKGAPAGQVIVEKEEVVMVTPTSPQ